MTLKEERVIERVYSTEEKINDWEHCSNPSICEHCRDLRYEDVYWVSTLITTYKFYIYKIQTITICNCYKLSLNLHCRWL